MLAFSAESRLQCMPVGISPMVLFYNSSDHFERMAFRGLPVPGGEQNNWDFEQFTAAAEFATKPRRGTRAIHVQPTVEGLAPFVYAGGGDVYNDAVSPTSWRSPSTAASRPSSRRWAWSATRASR